MSGLILSSISSPADAKWRLRDQIRMVNGNINSGISSLRGQMATPGGAAAVYSVVGRSNDVFTFCQQGIPLDSWIGVNPTSGTYQILNYWTVNWQWIPYYVVICPYGGATPGGFTGGDGGQFRSGPVPDIVLTPSPH